jgi:hypothetical protein
MQHHHRSYHLQSEQPATTQQGDGAGVQQHVQEQVPGTAHTFQEADQEQAEQDVQPHQQAALQQAGQHLQLHQQVVQERWVQMRTALLSYWVDHLGSHQEPSSALPDGGMGEGFADVAPGVPMINEANLQSAGVTGAAGGADASGAAGASGTAANSQGQPLLPGRTGAAPGGAAIEMVAMLPNLRSADQAAASHLTPLQLLLRWNRGEPVLERGIRQALDLGVEQALQEVLQEVLGLMMAAWGPRSSCRDELFRTAVSQVNSHLQELVGARITLAKALVTLAAQP